MSQSGKSGPVIIIKPATKLISGYAYGPNARDIYKRFCNAFGWDEGQTCNFNRGGIFNAKDAAEYDGNTYDVWFNYANSLVGKRLNTDAFWSKIDGDIIKQTVKIVQTYRTIARDYFGSNRIVFALNEKKSYIFLGVYKIINVERTPDFAFYEAIYERINDKYPI